MSSTGENEDKLQFSVDSSLLFQLGEQLVTKPSVALAELVKNAYDADATQAIVTMENVGRRGGTIVIEDNGHGMTFEEIQSGWMRIATPHKQYNPTSRYYRRPLTGAKGIGRFAARRLGEKLILQAVAERDDGTKEAVIVNFDWSRFAPGTNIDDIPIEFRREPVSLDTRTGVSLFIEVARDVWTTDEISALRRDLLSIQSPFPDLVKKAKRYESNDIDPGFTLGLEIEGSETLKEFSGDLGEAFLNLNWAKLEGWIDKEGLANYEVVIRNTGEKDRFLDEDTEIYNELKGISFRVYYFVEERGVTVTGSDFRLRDFRNKSDQEGGVRIYLDDFRVFPYATEGNDWLLNDYYGVRNVDMALQVNMPEPIQDLGKVVREETRRQGGDPRFHLLIPRNRQLFGAVLISQQDHPDLRITASREGFFENEAFEKLRRFVQRGLYWLTLKRAAETIKPRAEARQQRQEHRKSVTDLIEEVRSEIKTISPAATTIIPKENIIAETTVAVPQIDKESAEQLISQVREELTRQLEPILENVDNRLQEVSQQVKEEKEEAISEFAMLRLLASAGTSLMIMQHQIQALVDQVDYVQTSLVELRPHIPIDIRDRYDNLTQEVKSWYALVSTQVLQLGFILTPDNRQRRRRHALHEIVDNVRKSMAYYMEKNHVEFINTVPLDLRTPPMYQAELYAILLNILTNALKAVYGYSQREIKVEAARFDEKLFLRMFNTGKQISSEMRKKAFEPFISDSIPNPILGTGTGLGLTVVRDTVEFYSGEAHFIDADEPWRTGIELVIPYR